MKYFSSKKTNRPHMEKDGLPLLVIKKLTKIIQTLRTNSLQQNGGKIVQVFEVDYLNQLYQFPDL